MCIVIDLCSFNSVFKKNDTAFEPVRKWLFQGKGKMVFGGSTYAEELSRMQSYLSIVKELSRLNKVKVIDKDAVDAAEITIRAIEPNPDFDDPHIVAIIEESKCKLVCTLDTRSDKYIKDARFYKKARRPSIYRTEKHAHLLCDANISAACS